MKPLKKSVDILGTEYEIVLKNFEECSDFKENNVAAFCSVYEKQIVICNLESHPDFGNTPKETIQKIVKHSLRHEIIHAFLNESGLGVDSVISENGWAVNEEMVDWFAMQGQKIYKAWEEADAI